MNCALRATESCPLPVRHEAARRGWHVELLAAETKNGTASSLVGASGSLKSKQAESAGARGARLTVVWRNSRFTKSEFASAGPGERMNHFPHTKAITKKDNLVRGLRKMRAVHGRVYCFSPQAFILPTDYTKFVKQYAEDDEEEGEKTVWICKPSDMSRGRKIFLIKDLSDLHYDQQFVIQKYVPNPLTIGGYKLDLRVYVLVTSMHPLRVHVYRDGLARFGTQKYDSGMLDIDNVFAHLTNSSINKLSDTYGDEKDVIGSGAKWDFAQLRDWIENGATARGGVATNQVGAAAAAPRCNQGDDAAAASCGGFGPGSFDALWARICDVILLTLLSVVDTGDEDVSSSFFELLGFDILVDSKLKPWLLEVNCAPALSIECAKDAQVKEPLLRDLFDLVLRDRAQQLVQSPARAAPRRRKPALPRAARPTQSAPCPQDPAAPRGAKPGLLKPRPSTCSVPDGRDESEAKRQDGPSQSQTDSEAQLPDDEDRMCGNFERIFPFDDESEEAANAMLASVQAQKSARRPRADTGDVPAQVRAIVNMIKRRRGGRGANAASATVSTPATAATASPPPRAESRPLAQRPTRLLRSAQR